MKGVLDHNIRAGVGAALMWLFIFIVMVDPPNTVIHKKDIAFVLLMGYCVVNYRPDWSQLKYIVIMLLGVMVPWIFSEMRGVTTPDDEVVGVFKAISPVVLLMYVRNFDMVKLSRWPVVLCCLLVGGLFVLIACVPILESPIWMFCVERDNPIMMSHRYIMGIEIFSMYLKSNVSFVFAFMFFLTSLFDAKTRTVMRLFGLAIILFNFFISGTRSTMLVPLFFGLVTMYKMSGYSRLIKRLIRPVLYVSACLFVGLVYVLATEEGEASNLMKYGHLPSYLTLFGEHPEYLIFGQGPHAFFYSDGFERMTNETEWTYLELVRQFGAFSLLIIYVFFHPLATFWRHRKEQEVYLMMVAYITYLAIAGTNPLMLSSTGMITLLMAYSYERKLTQKEV